MTAKKKEPVSQVQIAKRVVETLDITVQSPLPHTDNKTDIWNIKTAQDVDDLRYYGSIAEDKRKQMVKAGEILEVNMPDGDCYYFHKDSLVAFCKAVVDTYGTEHR